MTSPTGQIVYAQSSGSTSTKPFLTVFFDRAPTSQDINNWLIGQRWIDTSIDPVQEYILQNLVSSNGVVTSNWVLLGHHLDNVDSLTGNTGGAVGPDSDNNINTLGDGIGITIAGNPATNTLTASLVGGGVAVQSFDVDANTPPGTDPVVANAGGVVTITGGQVAAGTTANVIRTDSLAANTFTIEIQRSQAVATSTVGANGVCHFDSNHFNVDSNAFVTLQGAQGLTWSDQSMSFAASSFNGYFIIGNATATLPASPANGDPVSFFVDGSFTVTVTANTGQIIRYTTNVSAVAGTAANTAAGDSINLVFRSTNNSWEAISAIGAWTIT